MPSKVQNMYMYICMNLEYLWPGLATSLEVVSRHMYRSSI